MIFDVQGRAAYAYTGGRRFDPTLPCVAFVHGALNDHSVWTLAARFLAHHGYSVLAFDLPGHMRSAGPVLPSIAALGAWIDEALASQGVTQGAAVVGHSMGSLIGLEAVARSPQRYARLVMVGTAYPMAVSPALLGTAQADPLKAMRMVNAFSISDWASKPSYPGPGAWLHGGGLALMRRVQASHAEGNLFAHDFALCNDYAGAPQAAAAVAAAGVRSHLVLGERDQMTPPKAAADLAAWLQATVHRLPAGHALMQEDPEGFRATLFRLLGPAAG